MKRILLTGSTGFVGRQVLRILKNRKVKITIIARDNKKIIKSNLYKNLKVITTKDLFFESEKWWVSKCKNIDTIIHLAWYAKPVNYQDSLKNIDCLVGSLNIAKGAIKAGVKKFVGIGTCFEYDLAPKLITVKTPLKPTTLYSDTKASLYLSLSHLLPKFKIEFNWCRLFYLYGQGEDHRRLVPYIRKRLENNKKVELRSKNHIRDYLDVEDAAKMIVDISLGNQSGVFNVCSGKPVTIKKLAEKIADEYGKRHLLKFNINLKNKNNPPSVLGVPNLLRKNRKKKV